MSYGVVRIGDRDVPMQANAASPIRYKQVFHKNIMPLFTEELPEAEAQEMLMELAYVMASAPPLSYDGYIAWLEQFDALDFFTAPVIEGIRDIYAGNLVTGSEVKKSPDLQTD